MSVLKKVITLGFVALFGLGVAACAPEVGSPEWCEQMKEKPKGDWSANEATDFAKNCIM
ncbi:DUF3012 domain-containing protein [Magnetovibrio sp. PR-2]|uniref:DUF3012 domain-containing protein n=1 Tax=Magnetovibrio sp. PR-2 TaxID=3120356 RepID=UPI002FCE24C4